MILTKLSECNAISKLLNDVRLLNQNVDCFRSAKLKLFSYKVTPREAHQKPTKVARQTPRPLLMNMMSYNNDNEDDFDENCLDSSAGSAHTLSRGASNLFNNNCFHICF